MDDSLIVELYWQRKESAIKETEKKYAKYLMKIAQNVLADREDSEEAVNDTYLRAWNSMPDNRPGALAAYLGKITRQLSIDIFRKRTSKKRIGSEYAVSLSELSECVSGEDDPSQNAELRFLADKISEYLSSVSKEARDVFVCRYYFMDSIKEIAAYSGAGESKIKSMLWRTRAGLKDFLKREGFSV